MTNRLIFAACIAVGCVEIDADMGGVPVVLEQQEPDWCDDPLPCPNGDPDDRFATCDVLTCTLEPCDAEYTDRICARCWQMPIYRTDTPQGPIWSDGEKFKACDRDGTLRAEGRVDEGGIPMCQWLCEPQHCPAPGGNELPACDG